MTGGEALLRWGRHDAACPAHSSLAQDCTCGLALAIAERLRWEEHERAVSEHVRIVAECRREDRRRDAARTRPPPTSIPGPHAIAKLPEARMVGAAVPSGLRRRLPVIIAATIAATVVNICAAIARYLLS